MVSDMPPRAHAVPMAFFPEIAGDASGLRLWVPLARDQYSDSCRKNIPGGSENGLCHGFRRRTAPQQPLSDYGQDLRSCDLHMSSRREAQKA